MYKIENNKKLIEKYIYDNYSLKPISEIKYLKHNDINSKNFIFQTSNDEYILKFINEPQPKQKIEKIAKILDFCIKNNCKVSKPIKNKKQSFFDSKNNAFLIKYFKGNNYCGTKLEYMNAIKSIAIFHKTLAKYNETYNYKTNDKFFKIFKTNELSDISKKIKEKKSLDNFDKKVLTEIEFIRSQILINDTFMDFIKTQKINKQLIHHDLHYENMIFNNGTVSGIIDFIDLRKGYLIEDVVFAAFKFLTFSAKIKKISKKDMNSFLDEYSKYNFLSDKEKDLALSFLRKKFLSKISFILKKRYYSKADAWEVDFEKYTKNLKLIERF